MFSVVFETKEDAIKCLVSAKNLKVKFGMDDPRDRDLAIMSEEPLTLGDITDSSGGDINWEQIPGPIFYYPKP